MEFPTSPGKRDSVESISESRRISLLEIMGELPSYDPEKGSLIDQAFEELKQQTFDIQSCLRIAGSYILENHSTFEDKEENIKGNLLRWLLIEALETNPSLFGPYADELNEYFKCLVDHSATEGIQWQKEKDEELSVMEQGQLFNQMDARKAEALSSLNADKPLVFALNSTGMGDVILMVPAIQNLAYTLNMFGYNSQIRLVVNEKIVNMVRYLVKEFTNIQLFQTGINDDIIYISKLATNNNFDHIIFERILSSKYSSSRFGIIFLIGMKDISELFSKNILCCKLSFAVASIDSRDSDKNISTNFRRAAQRSISNFLGMKIFNTDRRDDLIWCSKGMRNYIEAHLQSDPCLQASLVEVKKRAGFENGYICIVEQGSTDIKRITLSLLAKILDELADFCQKNKFGVILIKSGRNKDDNGEELSSSLAHHNVPYWEISIDKELAYTLAFLQGARGVIGPDTFLTHAAEYLLEIPILNFFVDSSSHTYRVNENVISVDHPIARRADKDLLIYVPKISSLYAHEIMHPLAVISTDAANSHLHPIIQEVQGTFLQHTSQGLEEFKRRVIK